MANQDLACSRVPGQHTQRTQPTHFCCQLLLNIRFALRNSGLQVKSLSKGSYGSSFPPLQISAPTSKASVRRTEIRSGFYAPFRSAEAEVCWINFGLNKLLLLQLYELIYFFFIKEKRKTVSLLLVVNFLLHSLLP